tara:strand:+ start:603 stop:848 length:246 start_codon:yes stop_codon:yes gene_type:complete
MKYKEYKLEDIGITTNSLNHITFQDGKRYEVHNFILTSTFHQKEPKYFQLWGQWYPENEDPISECIAGRIEEIKYFEVQYS